MDKTRPGSTVELVRIGRSWGILLSRRLLNKLLHRAGESRQSWERTYRAIAATDEDWSDFEVTAGDGLVR